MISTDPVKGFPISQQSEINIESQGFQMNSANINSQSAFPTVYTSVSMVTVTNQPSTVVSTEEMTSLGLDTINPRQQKYYNILVQEADRRQYLVLGAYNGAHTKIKMKCPNKHIIEITPNSFRCGTGCVKCLDNCPIQAKEELYSQAKTRGYQILGVYINTHTKIRMQCPNKHVIDITPNSFKRGTTCAKCNGNCPIQSEEDLHLQAAERGYKILGNYHNSETKIKMQCPNNHIIDIRPDNFKSYGSCAKCTDMCPIQAKEDLYSKAVERDYRILGTYINARSKILMECRNKHLIEIFPTNFKRGSGCKVCEESSGEQLVRAALEYLNLSFTSQYVLSSLMNRHYDFMIILHNQQRVFIEWDGGQHFGYCSLFHKTDQDFFEDQQHDIIKTQQVMNYRNKMIRIDYTWLDKRVEEIAGFIMQGIQSSQILVLSNPQMYEWLSSRIIIPDDTVPIIKKTVSIKLVIKDHRQSSVKQNS